MTYVLERLYLGDIDDAYKTIELRERKGITHILTADSKPLSVEARQGFSYLHIHALDTEDFDILSHLEAGIKFIDEGRQNGAVLVHCWAGQSRSATIVMSYIMKLLSLNVEEADALVRCQCPGIQPNDGFVAQLNLFYEMNCKVDLTNQLYRKYRLDLLSQQMQRDYSTVEFQCQRSTNVTAVSTRVDLRLPNCPGGQMSQFQLSEGMPLECFSADPSSSSSADTGDMVYRCSKCRRPLFRQSGVLAHEVFTGSKTQFKGHHGSSVKDSSSVTCDVFVEPVAWMSTMILSIEGKLSCPKCNAKIGSFNWAGERCPCGSWVTPAFHVQKSKVDACPSAVMNVHRPVLLPCGPRPSTSDNSPTPLKTSLAGLVVMNTPDGQQQIASNSGDKCT